MARQVCAVPLGPEDRVAMTRRPSTLPVSPWVVGLLREDVRRQGVFPGELPRVAVREAVDRISVSIPEDLVPAVDRRRGHGSMAEYIRGVLRSTVRRATAVASPPSPQRAVPGASPPSPSRKAEAAASVTNREPLPQPVPRTPASPSLRNETPSMIHTPTIELPTRITREPLVAVREKEYRDLPISYLDRLLTELRQSGASEPHVILFRDAEAMTDRAVHLALDTLEEHQTIRLMAGVFPASFDLVGLETDEINAAWSRLTAAMGTYRRAWRITVEPTIFWAATAFDEDGDWTERAGVMMVKVVWRGRQA